MCIRDSYTVIHAFAGAQHHGLGDLLDDGCQRLLLLRDFFGDDGDGRGGRAMTAIPNARPATDYRGKVKAAWGDTCLLYTSRCV